MQQLRDGITVESISRSLQEYPAVVATNIGDPLGNNNLARIAQESPSSSNSIGAMEKEYEEEKQHVNDREPWTAVTSDDAFIERLLLLYFC